MPCLEAICFLRLRYRCILRRKRKGGRGEGAGEMCACERQGRWERERVEGRGREGSGIHGRERLFIVLEALLVPLWPEALQRRRVQGLPQLSAVHLPLLLERPLPHPPSSPLPLDRILSRDQRGMRCPTDLRVHPTSPLGSPCDAASQGRRVTSLSSEVGASHSLFVSNFFPRPKGITLQVFSQAQGDQGKLISLWTNVPKKSVLTGDMLRQRPHLFSLVRSGRLYTGPILLECASQLVILPWKREFAVGAFPGAGVAAAWKEGGKRRDGSRGICDGALLPGPHQDYGWSR